MSSFRILYAEDEKQTSEELMDIFELKAFNVVHACDGLEAWEFFQSSPFDAVITDVQMPRMNGLELVQKIKERDPEIPVLVITAFNDSELLMESIEIGVDYYLTKPVKPKLLFQKLEKIENILLERQAFELNKRLLEDYRHAVDQSTIFSISDLKGKVTYANKKLLEVSGYKAEELIGKPHNIFRHPDMPEEVFKELWDTIRAKKTWQGKIKNQRKDGTPYYVDAYVCPLIDEKGNIIEYISIRHDITEQEVMREMLQKERDMSIDEMELYMHRAYEHEKAIDAATAYIRIDESGKIFEANVQFCQIIKQDKREVLVQKFQELCAFKEGSFSELIEQMHQKKNYKKVVCFKDRFGNEVSFNATFVPITDKSGNVVDILAVLNDITAILELSEEIENTQKEIVYHIGEMAEERSKETGLHVKRVAYFSEILANAYGLSERDVHTLKLAAPMHDVGKIAIPDNILNKPGKLTTEEFEVMKTHSQIGHDLFKDSKRPILKAAATVALEHHEKYDGTGYPNKKKGEDIHIYGRIVAIADVFDALGCDRVYKKAWELERILELFKVERGKHFDPELVDIFFNHLDKFLKIREEFKDS